MAGVPLVPSLFAKARREPSVAMGPATRFGNAAGCDTERTIGVHCACKVAAAERTANAATKRNAVRCLISRPGAGAYTNCGTFPRPLMEPATGQSSRRYLFVLSLGALGVVYGDIGTSPLYALRECFRPEH